MGRPEDSSINLEARATQPGPEKKPAGAGSCLPPSALNLKFLSLAAGLRQGAGRSGEPEPESLRLRVKFVQSDREPELHEVGLRLLYQIGLMGPASPVYTPAGPTGAGSVVPDTPGPLPVGTSTMVRAGLLPANFNLKYPPIRHLIPGRRPARLARRELPAFPINP